jgi:hypothetical protein
LEIIDEYCNAIWHNHGQCIKSTFVLYTNNN